MASIAFEEYKNKLNNLRPALDDLGGALHGELGWLLLVLAIGHAFMAFWHRRDPKQDVLPRMLG